MLVVHDNYNNSLNIYYVDDDGTVLVDHEVAPYEGEFLTYVCGIQFLDSLRTLFQSHTIYDGIDECTIVTEWKGEL